jgi:hypothetical protein
MQVIRWQGAEQPEEQDAKGRAGCAYVEPRGVTCLEATR